MNRALKLLVVEDSEDDAELVIRLLRRSGFAPQHERVESAAAMAAALQRQSWDAVVSDYNMPGFSGLDALRILRATGLDIPFILISGTVGEEIAVDALKAGAADYVLKMNLSRLALVLERELKEAAIRAEHRQAQRKLLESEAGLRHAQDMAKLAHVITRPDGSFENWSESLPKLIGLEPAQMPGSTREWLKRIHPEDYDLFRTTSIEAGRHSTRMSVEYRIRHEDGAWIHISQVTEPIDAPADAAGGMRWFGTLQDVSERKLAEQELRRFQFAMDMSSDSIYLTDVERMRFVYVNNVACRRLGYPRDKLLRMGPEDVLGKDREQIRREYDAVIAAGAEGMRFESRFARSDLGEGWTEIHRVALLSDGKWLIVTIGRDITERKKADEGIRRLNRVYAVLSGINSAIVRIRERDELFSEACRIAVAEGGFTVARVLELDANGGARIAASSEPDSRQYQRIIDEYNSNSAHSQSLIARALRSGQPLISNDVAQDARIPDRAALTKGGNYSLALLPLIVDKRVAGAFVLRAREAGMFNEDEMRLLLELVSDISFALEVMDKQKRLDYLAYYDALTGLANRALFHERLTQHVRAAQQSEGKLALVLADIERFKAINDSLGRPAGDALLKQVAERLARAADPVNVARLGGDHFALVLPEIKGRSEIGRRIERIWRECFAQPFRLEDTELRVSAKAGIALFPSDGDDADRLFANAEAALRKAKRKGDRLQFHSREMTDSVAGQLSLENNLRRALENEEFVLHYQPKVDSETRSIVGVEALIRWQSPELGLVPPMKFIPLMEETGLILPVGAWALKRASLDHRNWVNQGLKAPRIAVNVSPIQLRQRDFVATLEQAIIEGVAPTGIDLELTESLIMEDVKGSIEKLSAARQLGVQIAIDDFGTGYSSLGYLAKLPVQTLKIDRSFIITMLKDPDTMTLVQTIISLAHSLRLKVVAEGVDAEEQAKMLRLLRCDEMQGYLFSKPVPFEQVTALLKPEGAAGKQQNSHV